MENQNDASDGRSDSTAELDAVGWQQGRLLPTKQVQRWTLQQQIAAREIEECMAFAFFTAEDEGRGRVLVAKFDTAQECRAAVDEHNRALRREKAAN